MRIVAAHRRCPLWLLLLGATLLGACLKSSSPPQKPPARRSLPPKIFIQKYLALVESMPHVDAVIVSADNKVIISSGLKRKYFQLHHPTL